MGYSLLQYAENYLRPFNNDFWRWSDDGAVIEWFDGQTIAFREEVVDVLLQMDHDKFYPFGTIVLALAACQENWKIDARADFLEYLIDPAYAHANTHTRPYLKDTLTFMNLIRQLPADLRKGVYKTHLICNHVLTGDAIPELLNHAMPMILGLQAGKIQDIVRHCGHPVTSKIYESILTPFDDALLLADTVEQLESNLRTGVRNPPPSMDSTPEHTGGTLIDELLTDPETAGLARMAKHLIAALYIPMHTVAPAEQLPLGGVSDITNRGSFDKLLLTELAQDDALLTARLVNNEALYLRREEPPDETPRERTILIDTTLRMWGTSRVLATAAALAYTQRTDPGATTDTYALSAGHFTKVDLTTRRGVLSAMEKMDPGLDCTDGMNRFIRITDTKTDLVFITEAESITQPEMQIALSEWRMELKFLVTVSRSGEIIVYEYIQGSRKLISTVKFLLDDTLFASQPVIKSQREDRIEKGHDSVAFLKAKPCPLYFPSVETTISNTTTYHHEDIGLLSVTRTNRLLFWRSRSSGAIELKHNIEAGSYCFGHQGSNYAFLLIYNIPSEEPVLYTITLLPVVNITKHILSDVDFVKPEPYKAVVFLQPYFYLKAGDAVQAYHPVKHHWGIPSGMTWPSVKATTGNWKNFINNGYSVLQRADNVAIAGTGKLTLGALQLSLVDDQSLRLTRAGTHRSQEKIHASGPVMVTLTANSRVRFQRFEWPNGSTAIIDSRGLLHLRSAATALPEITIVLAIGVNIAAWASDGTSCGPGYFADIRNTNTIMENVFYEKYIQRYIDNLQ